MLAQDDKILSVRLLFRTKAQCRARLPKYSFIDRSKRDTRLYLNEYFFGKNRPCIFDSNPVRNSVAIEPGHPVYRMRDVVDESAGGSGIREIRPGTFRKYVRQKAGCATFGATIIVE